MRKMTLAALFVVLLAGSAFAHNGAISLYTDGSLGDCDLTINPFEDTPIGVFYVRGTGYEMGKAAEFMCQLSDASAIFSAAPIWANEILLTLGTIDTGITITGSACLGVGLDVVHLGTIYVMSFGVSEFNCRVVAHPVSGGILITRCNDNNDIASVLGGTFIFSATPNSCNPAVNTATWGTIKALYK